MSVFIDRYTLGYTGTIIEGLYTSFPGRVLVKLDDTKIVLPFEKPQVVQPFVSTDEGVYWKHTEKTPEMSAGLTVTLCPDEEGQVQAIGRIDEEYIAPRLRAYRLLERRGLKRTSKLDRSSSGTRYSVLWEGVNPTHTPKKIRNHENVDNLNYARTWQVFDPYQEAWVSTYFNKNWQEYENEEWIIRKFSRKG